MILLLYSVSVRCIRLFDLLNYCLHQMGLGKTAQSIAVLEFQHQLLHRKGCSFLKSGHIVAHDRYCHVDESNADCGSCRTVPYSRTTDDSGSLAKRNSDLDRHGMLKIPWTWSQFIFLNGMLTYLYLCAVLRPVCWISS